MQMKLIYSTLVTVYVYVHRCTDADEKIDKLNVQLPPPVKYVVGRRSRVTGTGRSTVHGQGQADSAREE